MRGLKPLIPMFISVHIYGINFIVLNVKPILVVQVYVKFSALFRVSRKSFPYEDLAQTLSQVISRFGANRVMWGR